MRDQPMLPVRGEHSRRGSAFAALVDEPIRALQPRRPGRGEPQRRESRARATRLDIVGGRFLGFRRLRVLRPGQAIVAPDPVDAAECWFLPNTDSTLFQRFPAGSASSGRTWRRGMVMRRSTVSRCGSGPLGRRVLRCGLKVRGRRSAMGCHRSRVCFPPAPILFYVNLRLTINAFRCGIIAAQMAFTWHCPCDFFATIR